MPQMLPVQSLGTFAANEKLNSKSPDVIATIEAKNIGIELTAYRDDSLKDSWGAVVPMIREAVRCCDASFPSLRGLLIGYRPNLNKLPPRKYDVAEFANQLLDAVVASLPAAPSSTGSDRCIAIRGPFDRWKHLANHIQAISVTIPARSIDLPVDATTGFASAYGTSIDALTEIIEKKISRFNMSYTNGIHENWLLIHAAGYPESSFITPLQQDEIERLLASKVRVKAVSSPYTKVILWDYIHGGYVDLVTGEHVAFEP